MLYLCYKLDNFPVLLHPLPCNACQTQTDLMRCFQNGLKLFLQRHLRKSSPVKEAVPQESNPQIFLLKLKFCCESRSILIQINLPDTDPTLCLLNPSTYIDLQTSTLTPNLSSKTTFDRIMGNFPGLGIRSFPKNVPFFPFFSVLFRSL